MRTGVRQLTGWPDSTFHDIVIEESHRGFGVYHLKTLVNQRTQLLGTTLTCTQTQRNGKKIHTIHSKTISKASNNAKKSPSATI